MAFREIGRGREVIFTFTAIMNMLPAFSNHNYDMALLENQIKVL